MTAITLTDGSITVTIYGQKVDWDLTKEWKINTIPNTASSWAKTTLSAEAAVTATAIVVTSATNFAVGDKISIMGVDGSGNPHTDIQTIASIAGTTLNLNGALGATYVAAGSSVIREGRLISLDFNRMVESITLTGLIVASATKSVVGVCQDLQALALGGGSIAITYGPYKFAEMAVTKINITETVEDQGSGTDPSQYSVIVNLTYSGKAIGES